MVYSAFLVIFRCSLSCPRLSAMLGILSSGIILTLFKCKERQLVFNENEVQSKGRKKKKRLHLENMGAWGHRAAGEKEGRQFRVSRRISTPSCYSASCFISPPLLQDVACGRLGAAVLTWLRKCNCRG